MNNPLHEQSSNVPESSAPAGKGSSNVPAMAWGAIAIVASVALTDAAVETFLSQTSRWVVASAVLVYFLVSALLWKRTQWKTKGALSALFLFALVVVTAWLPGGMDRGLVIARRSTRSLLQAITGHIGLASKHSGASDDSYSSPSLASDGELTNVNVALDENGGAIESISGTTDPATQFYGPGFNGRRLIDGKTSPVWAGDPSSDPSSFEHPHTVPGIPLEIVLSFYGHQSALVGAVVIVPGNDLNFAARDVEVWTSNTSPSEGFQKVGGTTLPRKASDHQIVFSALEAIYVKVRVLSNQNPEKGIDVATGKPSLQIAEIRVLEARRAGYVSIRDRSPHLPYWKGSPRYAAQRGIEWMQATSVAWQKTNNCFGCHMQAQVVMGLAVAKQNGYIVDDQASRDMIEFIKTQQQPDGSYGRDGEGSTAFAGMGLAHWDDIEGIKQDPNLRKAADFLLTKQQASGELPYMDDEGARRLGLFDRLGSLSVLQGPLMPTGNSLTTFQRAYEETTDSRYKAAAKRALAWIAAASPVTTQDKVFKIMALSRFGGGAYNSVVQRTVERVIAEQTPSGGWPAGIPGLTDANPFSTGQVLYAFKQAGVSIKSSPFIKGVKYLLTTQRDDGSWKSDQSAMNTMGAPYAPSMWATIGLAGAFPDLATGTLQIATETGPDQAALHNLEVILDCSGSMRRPLGSSTRISTARDVLRQVLAQLPDDFNVGLRLYAHRYSWKDMEQSCTDTELVVPIEKLDRQRLLDTVDNVQPRGDTPLVYSVRQTPTDLKAVGGGSVIVITDGQETCHGDPVQAAAELKSSGIPVTLNIIGFTLAGKEKHDVEQLMRPFAEATGGHYYYAENGEQLVHALSLAALDKFPYEVFDTSGQQVANGQVGTLSTDLLPGDYKVVVHAGDQQLSQNVSVKEDEHELLKLVREGQQFILVREQGQAGQPMKQVASGQGAQ